ncbi:hypothetical protein TRVL_09928 [Trypanosoma vivax]|nr:hypothetical protein TRVL_09928 [Trypanosoma vivax]
MQYLCIAWPKMYTWRLPHAVRNRAFILVNLTHSTCEVRSTCEALLRECAASSYQAFAQPAMWGSKEKSGAAMLFWRTLCDKRLCELEGGAFIRVLRFCLCLL